ncbi:MAG TPA: hypothetical protein VFZ93_14750, partial [Albitalea sp.]
MTLDRPTRRRLHRLRLGIEAFVAFVVIAGALVIGSAGLLLPWLVQHPERVEAFIAKQLGRPVVIERVEGDWKPSGPVFTLRGVTLGTRTPFAIERAELAVDFYSWLKRDASFTEFRIVGVAVDVVREPDGDWRVTQFGEANVGRAGTGLPLLGPGSFSLRDARLSITDLASGASVRFAQFDARLVDDIGGRRLGGRLVAGRGSPPLRFACAFDAGTDGRCYLEGIGLEPARWLSSYPLAGIAPVRGELDLRAWFTLDAGRVRDAQAEFATRALALRGAAPVELRGGAEIEPRHAPSDLSGGARFVRSGDGWRLDLVEDAAGGAAPSALAIVAQGEAAARRYDVSAPRVELARVMPLLALSSSVPPALRSFAFENAPRGAFSALRASLGPDGFALSARAHELGLEPGAGRPGFGTLSGTLVGDRDAIVLVADPEQAVVLDHATMFRTPLAATLHRATLAALRIDGGWRIEASDFDLDGAGWGAQGSAALEFGGPGRRPFLDARVRIRPGGSVPAAKLFWPINVMK